MNATNQLTTSSTMSEITIPMSNEPDYVFHGVLIATVCGDDYPDYMCYRPTNDGWDTLTLYKTESGKYVVHVSSQTINMYNPETTMLEVVTSSHGVIELLGFADLSKELYKAARIETRTIIS